MTDICVICGFRCSANHMLTVRIGARYIKTPVHKGSCQQVLEKRFDRAIYLELSACKKMLAHPAVGTEARAGGK
jgi:hypothetical protein